MQALEKYKAASGVLEVSADDKDNNELSPEVRDAIRLLRQDVNERIRDMETLVEIQKPVASQHVQMPVSTLLGMNSSMQAMSKTRSWDGGRNGNDTTGLQTEPFLGRILNKLQSNLTMRIEERMKDKEGKTSVETIVNQQLVQFRKDLAVYEQRKVREYTSRLEQANKENRKLSNQIVRLRERWDSLVESAKQRRIRQQEE